MSYLSPFSRHAEIIKLCFRLASLELFTSCKFYIEHKIYKLLAEFC